jgi:hypothetical protein
MSLNDLEEKCRSVLNWFGENLKKIALVIVVNQNFELLQGCNIFLYLNAGMFKALSQPFIVSIRNGQELNTSVLKSCDSLNDVGSRESNMLYSSSTIVINVLLDLRLSLSISGFIDGHLNFFIKVSYDDGSEGRIISVNNAIIDGPESVEVKHLLIPLGYTLHL